MKGIFHCTRAPHPPPPGPLPGVSRPAVLEERGWLRATCFMQATDVSADAVLLARIRRLFQPLPQGGGRGEAGEGLGPGPG